MTAPDLICPKCGSRRVWKDGFRPSNLGKIQRYCCKKCGYRFSNNHFKDCLTSRGCQICVSDKKAKNLVEVEPSKDRLAGATIDIKGKIIEFLWFLKKEGKAESTMERQGRYIHVISERGGNLFDPESVKLTIANQDNWEPVTKKRACEAYTNFLRMLGMTWNAPKYQRVRKLPFIPTEKEVDNLISSCNRKTCTFLKLLKETGMRSGEAWILQWIDFNFEDKTVSVTPEKGGNPRVLPITNELIAMLNSLPKKSNIVFAGSLRHFGRSFRRQRKKASEKLKNPRINEITFHTLRHFKATMEYHKTKDILHVKQILGHKSINSTLLYTQLISFKENEYYVKVAHNTDEACELIKSGFQYETGEYYDGGKIFKKPK